MDKFVKNFIIMSIIYLGIASILGLTMLGNPQLMHYKFVHSHLNMLGWVSMMIFGVGYHILPRFMGKPLKSPKIGAAHFWLANTSLIGMLLFYILGSMTVSLLFGLVQAFSIFLFFYNMLATIYARSAE